MSLSDAICYKCGYGLGSMCRCENTFSISEAARQRDGSANGLNNYKPSEPTDSWSQADWRKYRSCPNTKVYSATGVNGGGESYCGKCEYCRKAGYARRADGGFREPTALPERESQEMQIARRDARVVKFIEEALASGKTPFIKMPNGSNVQDDSRAMPLRTGEEISIARRCCSGYRIHCTRIYACIGVDFKNSVDTEQLLYASY